MRRLGYIVYLLLCLQLAIAQSTEGTEFWVTFMNNYNTPSGDSQVTLKLIASSRQDATMTVSNPQTGYTQTFAVQADQVAEFTVPHEQGYTFNAGSVEKRGLCVTSTAPISLYASNFEEHTYDASIVLPVTALGVDYAVQVYESLGMAKEMAVVATQNNTILTITPHARTSNGKVKNVPFSVNLNAGETYMLMSYDAGNDFSGTRVLSNYPVAVFAGHQCIYVPSDNKACDHIVEQQMPVQMWGKQFVLTKTKGQYGDLVLVTARDANTEVKVNGLKVTTLQAWESYEFRLTDNSAFVETSGPAACYLYLEGAERNDFIGDPSSVHISPVEQRVKEITFATFQTSISRTHYVNIVTTIAGVQSMMLDGKSVSGEFAEVQGNSKMRFAQIRIPHGTHTLKTGIDGFTGHVYGLGDCESYAYTFGSAARLLDGQILVDGVPRSDMIYDETRCYKVPITFSPHANVEFNTIEWDFGDGQKSTQKTNTHTYTSAGTYHVEMRIANEDGKDTARTTLTLIETLRDTIYATICNGEKFTLAGETFTTEGKHEVVLSSKGGCDSIVTLYLTVGKTYETNETATFRKGSSYRWHNRWYREDGVYRDTLPTIYGCDSIFILTLTSIEASIEMTDTICWQPTYNFRGYDYVLPPVDNYKDQEYINYTLEYFDKEECEHYRMDLAIVPKEKGSYELYEDIQDGETYDFFGEKISVEGDYTKTIGSACNCVQEYTLHLRVHSYPINKVKASLCKKGSYTYRGKQYSEPGVYRDTVFSPAGIEEVYELALSDNRSFTEISISNVPSYEFKGKTLTESGTYRDTLTNVAGCDSIVTLYLGIHQPCKIQTEISMNLCEGESFPWGSYTCEPGKDYVQSFTSVHGCDSIVTLHVAKLEKTQKTVEVEICDGDYCRMNDVKYTDAGEYTIPLKASNGCDSILTLRLTVRSKSESHKDAHIFTGESYLWNGISYTEEGDYSSIAIDSHNCDSTAWLHLKVTDKPVINRTETDVKCSGETFFWQGEYRTPTEDNNVFTARVWGAEADTLITLTVTVHPTYPNMKVTDYICKGETYTWNGTPYTAEGDYKYETKTVHGCDSIVTLHLRHYPVYKSVIDRQSICEGDKYHWEGDDYTVSGDYTKTLHTIHGCDSIVTLRLKVNDKYNVTDEPVEVCYGKSYVWNGVPYSTSGTYTQNLSSSAGCDSIVTRTITVLPKSESHQDAHIFTGETFHWNGTDYTVTGDYPYVTPDSHGCDSTAWLHLSVKDKPVYDSTETPIAKCSGETFFWYGEYRTPTEDNNVFTHRIWGAEEDTLITLTVTVYPAYPNLQVTEYICKGETYTWNGTPYTAEGDYKFETKTVHGCDSIVTLHLRHRPVYDDVIDNQSICEGEKYRWEGNDYTASGDYTKKLQTVYGCDSTVTLRLTVNKKYNLTDEAVEVCYGKSFVWNGVSYTASGTYTQNLKSTAGCDSIVTRTITVLPESRSDSSAHIFTGETFHWNGKDYTVTGDYSYITPDSHNCDSTAWLHLSVTDKPVYDSTETTVKCSGETFFWQGENRTPTESNNIFEKRLWGAESDTLITLIVTIHPVYPKVDDPQYICEGDTYTWEGDVYSDEGDYTKNLQTIHGCDSIVTLHLRISPVYDGIIDKQSICEGEKYHWEGEDYTVSGNYTKTLHTVYGCDSIVTLILDVWPTFTKEVTDTILTGETYTIDGRTFSASGDYTIPHTTQHGCDSTVILHLTANSVSIADIQSNALCANEATIEIFVTYTGDIHEARITFTPEAKAAGWRDTVVVIGADGTIRLPNIGRAGIHHGTIELLFRGRLAASGKIVLSLLYPSSVLEQAWNDVVAVLAHNYNGGYDFVAFQWYENGVELVGETRSYLYKPLIMGGEYSALLTEQNGTQQMTCPIIAKPQEDLSLYPTVAAPRQQIHCNVPEQGELVLYDPMGKRVVQMKLTIGDNTFVAPAESGIYATQVVLQGSNNTKTYKLIVR